VAQVIAARSVNRHSSSSGIMPEEAEIEPENLHESIKEERSQPPPDYRSFKDARALARRPWQVGQPSTSTAKVRAG
jgi:hypothetical protein